MTQFTLRSGALRVDLVSVGASIQRILVPDRDGCVKDVVLGFDSDAAYASNPFYFGCVVGRVANRIANGRFRLNGRDYQLETNNGPNHLHGGSDGLHQRHWTATEVSETAVTFVYLSPDGESGYPGSVAFSVKYELVGDNQLRVTMQGRVLGDLKTPINLAQHSYFNLAGHSSGGDVLGHELRMEADTFLALDASQIPTGVRQSVGDPACMDFRRGKRIGAGIDAVPGGMGYDHTYCFSGDDAPEVREVREVAELRDPQSGRIMVVSTNAPGAQLYTAGYLDGSLTCKENCRYEKYGGVCIETQALPDSINREEFLKGGSNVVYGPADDAYRHVVTYTFKTDRSVPSKPSSDKAVTHV